MSEALKKGFEKLMGKFVDAEIIEPLGDFLVNAISILDIDSKPEFNIKLMYVKAPSHETGKKERYVCIGIRKVEPES